MRCAVFVVALAACYHPSYEDCQVSCTTFGCPDGLTCEGGMCRTANAVGECAILPPDDGGIDGDGPPGSGAVTRIVAGATHTCAACGDSSLWCWGGNSAGQTSGPGLMQCNPNAPQPDCDPTPVQVALPGAVSALSAGHDWTCVLVDQSGTTRLFCMGNNAAGQFGVAGPLASRMLIDTGISGASAYAGGTYHACEIVNGRVQCQGINSNGQLGNGAIDPQPVAVPQETVPVVAATQLAVGDLHTCATTANTTPWCWGDNSHGELNGAPATSPVTNPRQFQFIPTAVELAAGAGHTCELTGDSVVCWGRNDVGQVGTGTATSTAGVTVLSLTGIQHVAAGGTQSCALSRDGVVYCWGSPTGDPNGAHLMPTVVTLPMAATALAVGGSHACAILADHSVWCWGKNAYGELGMGTFDTMLHDPTRVPVCE